jgi:PAS domain S-box-containing protein
VRGHHATVISVLYVDDESPGTDAAVEALAAADEFEVERIDHAAAAIDALESGSYDCVVSGYDLTQLDGLTFLEEVRERWADVPFVLYTGSGSERVASDAFSAGATDYVAKARTSEDPTVLADALHDAVEGAATSDATADLFDVLPDPALRLAFVDGDAVVRGVNPAFEDAFGFAADTLVGRSAGVLQVPGTGGGVPRSLSSGTEQDAVVTRMTTEGPRRFRYRTIPVTTDDGTPGIYAIYTAVDHEPDAVASGTDVATADGTTGSDDESSAAADTGSESSAAADAGHGTGLDREELDAALERAVTAAWVWEPARDLLACHAAVGRLFGIESSARIETLDDLLGRVHPVDRTDVETAFEDALDAGPLDVEFRVQTDDGERRWIAAHGEPHDAADGPALAGALVDITGRKRREEELRRYRRIVEASSDPVYVLDEEGRFEFVDDALVAATGFDREELVGEHVSKLLSDDEIETGQEVITALKNSDVERGVFECNIETAYGTERWCEINIALLEDADGDIDGTVGIVRDVTERKERERELERQTERLEEFASVVAHDLRNPLTVAIGHTEVLQEEYDDEFVDRIADAHERMERLIDDLLALAREGRIVDEAQPVALERVAEDAWATVATADADLVVETARTVEADADRLRTMFENLFRNAIEHGGDDVTVAVGDVDGDERGFYVEDDGPGIPAEDRETVFERGYSTDDGGTGFGLAIVGEIADAHGWDVRATESAGGDVTRDPSDGPEDERHGSVATEETGTATRQNGGAGGARFEVTGIDPVSDEER